MRLVLGCDLYTGEYGVDGLTVVVAVDASPSSRTSNDGNKTVIQKSTVFSLLLLQQRKLKWTFDRHLLT